MKVWICQVRKEAFVGGESQRCRHSGECEACKGTGEVCDPDPTKCTHDHDYCTGFTCPACNGSGQVSGCGVMELIGGEPVEWCIVHGAEASTDDTVVRICWKFEWLAEATECLFESQVRVGP